MHNIFRVNQVGGSLVAISWSLVCTHISHEFDLLWELNYHHLTTLGLGFGPSDLHGGFHHLH